MSKRFSWAEALFGSALAIAFAGLLIHTAIDLPDTLYKFSQSYFVAQLERFQTLAAALLASLAAVLTAYFGFIAPRVHERRRADIEVSNLARTLMMDIVQLQALCVVLHKSLLEVAEKFRDDATNSRCEKSVERLREQLTVVPAFVATVAPERLAHFGSRTNFSVLMLRKALRVLDLSIEQILTQDVRLKRDFLLLADRCAEIVVKGEDALEMLSSYIAHGARYTDRLPTPGTDTAVMRDIFTRTRSMNRVDLDRLGAAPGWSGT